MFARRILAVVLAGLIVMQGCTGFTAIVRSVAADPPPASHNILVGPGFSDVSPHELVRTSTNILYAIVPDCPAYPCAGAGYTGPANALHAYRAAAPGTPTAFNEVDIPHHPTGNIATAAAAIDGHGAIHVAWLTTNGSGNVFYAPFDTTSDTWGATTTLATTNWTDWNNTAEGVAVAVDAAGVPTVVYDSKGGDGLLHLWAASAADGWQPTQLDDVSLPVNAKPQHPALAFTAAGDLLVAYMVGTFNYVPDGVVYVRTRVGVAWGASAAIPDTAMTTIDNGPSLLITPDGTRHLTFLNTNDEIRYWYNPGDGWHGDQQPPVQQTHNPSLGPDGAGGVFIYGHGAPVGGIQGHGDNLYSFHKPAGGAWGLWTLYATGSFDSSVSTRWSQFFHFFPQAIDIVYWSDLEPYTLFLGSDIAPTAPAAHLVLTGFPSPTPAGAPQPFALTAQDATANIATGYVGTVHFASSDPLAALPHDYTFTAADHGTHAFSATLNTAGTQSLTATDTATSGITGSQTGIAVNPVLTGVSPTSGPVGGGARVTLTGAGFTNGASVIFDTATAANVQVINATTIMATTPPHMAGAVNVKVAIAGSTTAILPGAYTYGDLPNPLPVLQPTAPPGGATKAAPLPSLRPSAPTNLVSTPNPLPPPR
jgi:hypothetical protein